MIAPHGVELSPAVISAVEDAIRAFAKALRATQLYLPNNPTRAAAIAHARSAFGAVWQHEDPLVLRIHEHALLWEERVVYDDSERGSEGLPWLMYRDGLRQLTFHAGFEGDGLEGLLGVLQRARTTAPDDDDLVTLLWVADLPHVTYQHVESNGALHGQLTTDAELSTADALAPIAAPAAESTPVGDGPPPEFLRLDDFDSTLYFLEPRESAYLQDELRREYTDDPRIGAVSAVFEIVAMPVDVGTRLEAMGLMDLLLLEFLSATDFEMVAFVLREAADARLRVDDPAVIAALEELPVRLSAPSVMAQLLQAVDESSRTPSAAMLEGLFAELQPRALEALFGWLGSAQHSPARAGIERATLRLAAAHTGELARLLGAADPAVVQGAMRIATSLATPAAVAPLTRLLTSPNSTVRAEAVTALREIGTPGALQSLESAADDSDRDVRVTALRAIATRLHAPALPRLRAALKRKETRAADLGEKMALFEAFGALAGDTGVPELDVLLNARTLLGGAREPTEMRACAARALGLIATPLAFAALQRASDTKDMVVRSAVSRALRGSA